MLSSFKYLILFGLLGSATCFATGAKPPPLPVNRVIVNGLQLTVDASVSIEDSDLVTKDLDYLASQSFKSLDPSLADLFDMPEISVPSLQAWLGARIHYLVGSNFGADKKVVIARTSYSFENPNVFPDELQDSLVVDKNLKKQILAFAKYEPDTFLQNVGARLYLQSKTRQVLWTLGIANEDVELRSPRVGVLAVGEQFKKTSIPGSALDSAAHSILRLRSYFHEARHSDGNGKTLSFPLAACPVGHELEGQILCERNLNGAYKIGAEITKLLLADCSTCTTQEKEVLKAVYADDLNRVLKLRPILKNDPDTQMVIRALKSQRELYQNLIASETDEDKVQDYRLKLQSIEIEISRLQESLVIKRVQSTRGDPRPEGL